MKVGRLLLRASVGGFFIGHGTQKLFGWFGGQGLQGQAETFEQMGLKPGKVQATAAGAAETLGGAGVLLGYRTPLAAAGLVSVMATAINRVHLPNGPWAHKGGYEYNVVLAAAAVSLAESGPGSLSLDALRGKEKTGAKWGLFSLGLGLVGAGAAHVFTEMQAGKSADSAPEAGAADAGASVNGSDPVADSAPAAEPESASAGEPESAGEPDSAGEPEPGAEEASTPSTDA
ncbi:MAG: DoxX family membrane protein [Conexibacteraceae bacterium]|nr:DoxX family membrane protein [Conexibacteraceae bacterium]